MGGKTPEFVAQLERQKAELAARGFGDAVSWFTSESKSPPDQSRVLRKSTTPRILIPKPTFERGNERLEVTPIRIAHPVVTQSEPVSSVDLVYARALRIDRIRPDGVEPRVVVFEDPVRVTLSQISREIRIKGKPRPEGCWEVVKEWKLVDDGKQGRAYRKFIGAKFE